MLYSWTKLFSFQVSTVDCTTIEVLMPKVNPSLPHIFVSMNWMGSYPSTGMVILTSYGVSRAFSPEKFKNNQKIQMIEDINRAASTDTLHLQSTTKTEGDKVVGGFADAPEPDILTSKPLSGKVWEWSFKQRSDMSISFDFFFFF